MSGGKKYTLGLDVGSSSVKACLFNVENGKILASFTSPSDSELTISSPLPGFAEQEPDLWWEHAVKAITAVLKQNGVSRDDVAAIGIAYQMHGLVLLGNDSKPLRPAIIWCDSRAVEYGEKAFNKIGQEKCLKELLNSPGNFTAAKLAWVRENEPEIFEKASCFMLPGDYIALKLCGEATTTISGLSEGILWDFEKQEVASQVLSAFEIPERLLPRMVPTFGIQGQLTKISADLLGLSEGIPISYRAGDQPNNAWSLNVLNPGEVAATAGTSGVVYGVSDKAKSDEKSRINIFGHVNYSVENPSYGALLCINGTGILNGWTRNELSGRRLNYKQMDELAESVAIGSDGISVLPFGNGAERILENRNLGASFHGIDFNRHGSAHIFRAVQEGIVFALAYGVSIMREMGVSPSIVRAGKANMFQSALFREAFVCTNDVLLEFYDTDGSQGAARGAGVGAGIYKDFNEAFIGLNCLEHLEPDSKKQSRYKESYEKWQSVLKSELNLNT